MVLGRSIKKPRPGRNLGRGPGKTGAGFRLVAHDGGHFEDRQVHGDDPKRSDGPAQKDHQQRFDHRGQRLDRRVDLIVIKIGDLLEHGVQGSGLLAHGNHLHDHRGEDAALGQGVGDGPPFGDGRLGVHDGLFPR